jgi:hypothetical protein
MVKPGVQRERGSGTGWSELQYRYRAVQCSAAWCTWLTSIPQQLLPLGIVAAAAAFVLLWQPSHCNLCAT